jgi:hypothetical protein
MGPPFVCGAHSSVTVHISGPEACRNRGQGPAPCSSGQEDEEVHIPPTT